VRLKTILFFLSILIIAFLPVSSFQFFLKNDAFNGYFPSKFFMSESIHSGHLPLWNPYINFGLPQYGDMNSGYWSPVTWLIASTVGYNAYTFTIELLFYILLGGLGMYKLLGFWNMSHTVKFIGGIAFMCCGYNIGHLQHFNWISGAAFLPWCLWAYLILLRHFTLSACIRAAMLFYLLASSAHPGIIIGGIYFFGLVMLFTLISGEKITGRVGGFTKTAKSHLALLALLLLLSAGMITGYLDIIPHFVRGEKISLGDSLTNPANLRCWLSSLLPFITVKNTAFFSTDISMRNCYFSLTLAIFLIVALFGKKTSWQKFFLSAGFAFAILSAGGVFKTMAYKVLPGIGYIRLNGEFRIFAILSFIIIASMELHKWIEKKNGFSGIIKVVYYGIETILFTAIIFGIYESYASKESLIFSITGIENQTGGIAGKLKALIDAISFYDTCWIQGMIQLLLLWGIKFSLRKNNYTLLKQIVVADLILASLLNIPFTGAGKASVAAVQKVLNKSPAGIPAPPPGPIKYNDTISTAEKGLVGDWSFYNKQPGNYRQAFYPVELQNTREYYIASERNAALNVADHPLIFNASEITDSSLGNGVGQNVSPPSIKKFSGNGITVSIHSEKNSSLVYLQNYYPHWYYTNVNHKVKIMKAGLNFMQAPLQQGYNELSFLFEPTMVKTGMLLSLCTFILLLITLIYFLKKSEICT
jgi:hypothetical protein